MFTDSDLIARVARLPYAENLVSGDLLGACGVRVCSGRSCVRGSQVRRGCATGVWTAACVRGGCAWRRGWAAYVGRVPLVATRTRVVVARAGTWGLDDAVSSRSAGSGMRGCLSWCGVRWFFRGFCAGRRLGYSAAAAWGADTLRKGS
jgi:hypothetical protein